MRTFLTMAALTGAALFCLMFALPTVAQDEAWSGPATEVVVHGRAPEGPALWRVQKGDAQVIIIGILPTFPKAQVWKTQRVENALRGANLLITPATGRAGFATAWMAISHLNMPGHARLKDVLPPTLYARYEATARRAGVNTNDLARNKPIWAGARLRGRVLDRLGFDSDEPERTILRLARAQHVPAKPVARLAVKDILRDINAMDEAGSEACLSASLDDIDYNLDRAAIAARAWAVGDLATVHANYKSSTLAKCLSGSDKAAALSELTLRSTLEAITAALQTPGKSVAIVPLGSLLSHNGVLDRLRAGGASISTPS